VLRSHEKRAESDFVESGKCLDLFMNNWEQSTPHKALFVTLLLFPVKLK